MRFLVGILIFVFSGFSFGAPAKEPRKIVLITHEAPPWMGEKLPDKGALNYTLQKVFKDMGYDLEMRFVSSWPRAKSIALRDSTVDGYAPFATIENDDIFVFSDFLLENSWVIIERKDAPVVWDKFPDLTRYVAGNVVGVELRPGVKELAEKNKIRIETTTTDAYNLKKLATKRIDIVFMDPFSFRYTMAVTTELAPYKNLLQINPKPIEVTKYGVAIKKGRFPANFMPELNKRKGDIAKYAEEYMSNLTKNAKPQ